MKTSTLIRKAQLIIDSPEKWTKGAYARNENGLTVSETSDNAFSFCARGATLRIGYHMCPKLAGLGNFNDAPDTTWLDVQIAMDFLALLALDQRD
jgi:hypothetical protein